MCGRYDNLIAREAYRLLFEARRLPHIDGGPLPLPEMHRRSRWRGRRHRLDRISPSYPDPTSNTAPS